MQKPHWPTVKKLIIAFYKTHTSHVVFQSHGFYDDQWVLIMDDRSFEALATDLHTLKALISWSDVIQDEFRLSQADLLSI